MPDRNPYRNRRSRRPGPAFQRDRGPSTPVNMRPATSIELAYMVVNEDGNGLQVAISLLMAHGHVSGQINEFQFFTAAGQLLATSVTNPQPGADLVFDIENPLDYVMNAENPVTYILENPAPVNLSVIITGPNTGTMFPS